MLHTLFRDGDFLRLGEPGSELDKLVHKFLVPKALSLFAALGVHKGVPITRNRPAQYAYLTLQVRHVVMQLMYFASAKQPRPERLPQEILQCHV